MMKLLISILFLFSTLTLPAQQKARFQSMNAAGAVYGKNGTKLQVQSVNGARFGTWFTGVGVGIDWYYFRSVPLFLSVRKDFNPKPSTPFIYLDLGANLYWDDKYEEFKLPDGSPMFSHYAGTYFDAGIGYSGSEGGRLAAFIMLGFSRKVTREKERNFMCTPDDYIMTDYRFGRLCLKAGLSF